MKKEADVTSGPAESPAAAPAGARIRVGIGGWNFPEWRGGVFYPPGLAAARELAYAASRLTGIEVNATFYSSQSPATFARWRGEAPAGFQFALKAHRMATARKSLIEGAQAVAHFLESGVAQLGDRLGPIVWQLPAYTAFDADALEPFLALLPDAIDGVPLRHVLEPRHDSFRTPAYVRLARDYGVATVATDSPEFPNLFDVTGDFVYARLMRSQPDEAAGYTPAELARWAARARAWQQGGTPDDLPLIDAASAAPGAPRDVYIQFISAAKARNPAAAQALIALLSS